VVNIGEKSHKGEKVRNNEIKYKLNNKEMDVHWEKINVEFPFKGYIQPSRKTGYYDMVKKVVKWSGVDARVIDFGAGPCDKTALFSLVGMDVVAFDNLEDAWHKLNDNRQKILDFSAQVGIDYRLPNESVEFPFLTEKFDVIMAHDVLEHFHSSPRVLLNTILKCLKPNGILAITVPNAANLRKRIHLLFGKTNYNKYEYFYWYPGSWSGHVREYVRNDLELMNNFLGLDLLELSTYNLQLDVLPKMLRNPYKVFASFFPGIRDSWMLISRKPKTWSPKFRPNKEEHKEAFGNQYFDYTGTDFDWEDAGIY